MSEVSNFFTDTKKIEMMGWKIAKKSKRICFKSPSSVIILIPKGQKSSIKIKKSVKTKTSGSRKTKKPVKKLNASINKQSAVASKIRRTSHRKKGIKGSKSGNPKTIQTSKKKQSTKL